MVATSTGRRRRASALILAVITAVASFPLQPSSGGRFTSVRSNVFAAGVQLHSSADASSESSSAGGRRTRRKAASITDKNLYTILGADPAMSRTEIKRLYITLAKETHPDASTSSASDEDRFNEIAQAWDILSDAKSRRAYDRELAAQDFKDDIVKKAGEVAKEYGPAARDLYENFAIPFLRRTTATTLAGWSAVTEASSEVAADREREIKNGRDRVANDKYKLSGVTLSEVVQEVSEMERTNAGAGDALEDFGRAFQRVIEAGRNATRQIDGMELQEKSMELKRRADETRAESMEVLGKLTEIKSERLRLTFHTSSANFTSDDAIQFLDGYQSRQGEEDGVTLMQRMTFKHPVRQDIEAFASAEIEFDERTKEKSEVDQQMMGRQRALEEAERNARYAVKAEEQARKMLEDAQLQVTESQKMVSDAQKSIRDLDAMVRKADQDLAKAGTVLTRKQDVVRRELKRKADKVEGPVFDQSGDDGKVRLNPSFDRSSMNAMGFEDQSVAAIEALRRDEQRVEAEFLKLVEKASRLVSRSERLRLRSEELIGSQDAASGKSKTNNQGEVIGDSFQGITDEIMDAAQISNASRQNARMNPQ